MSDGKLEIDTSINTKGLTDGVKKVDSTLKTVAKGTAVFAGITAAVKGTTAAIKDTTEAYKVQAKAEKQLETAAKNNPYLDSNSVKQLKDYASQLQSISTVGDEELLPFMAQLASAGRTQAEIQQIMSTALDVSASGMMSLDSAVTQLNATYSGNVGLMGRQIAELKNLTAEELASGKAVEIMQKKFSGMAKEVAESTGSSEQLHNSIGDLKEQIGKGWENSFAPMRKGLQSFIDKWTEAIKKTNDAKDALNNLNNVLSKGSNSSTAVASATSTQTDIVVQTATELNDLKELSRISQIEYKKRTKAEKQLYSELETDYNNYLSRFRDGVRSENEVIAEATKTKSAEYEKQRADLKKLVEQDKTLRAEEKAMAEENAIIAQVNACDALRQKYDETIKAAKEDIEKRRALGATITEEEEAQKLLNVATEAYLTMMTDPAFKGNSGNYVHEVNARKEIADLYEKQAEAAKKAKEYTDLLSDSEKIAAEAADLVTESTKSLSEQIEEQIALIDEYISKNSDDVSDYAALMDEKKRLEQLQTEVVKVENEKRKQATKDAIADMASVINNYMNEFSSITSNIVSLVRKSNEEQTNAELGELSDQYNEGLISYEEYNEKKKEIEKKAAEEEYKLQMWEWSASILTATANIAEGISKAIAQGGVLGIITGALVGAAGATQIAAITAAKPKAPSFSTGGFLTGNSYSGDKIAFNGNAGEAILNPAEQRNFMDMANGDYKGNGTILNMPVSIINNTSSNVQTKMDKNGLRVIIDEMVNASMKQGRYDESMNIAETKSKGVSYL